MHDLFNLIVVILIFGVCMGIVNAFVPMPYAIKSLLNLLVSIVLIIYILEFFNLINPILPIIHVLK